MAKEIIYKNAHACFLRKHRLDLSLLPDLRCVLHIWAASVIVSSGTDLSQTLESCDRKGIQLSSEDAFTHVNRECNHLSSIAYSSGIKLKSNHCS